MFTNLDTEAVLDVVDGRRGTAVRWWLRQRPEPWRARVQIVAIDMSAEFRAAIRDALPTALIVADHWHVVGPGQPHGHLSLDPPGCRVG